MDSTGWILIALIICVIAALIRVNKKSKPPMVTKTIERVSEPDPTPVSHESAKITNPESMKNGKKYVSIYEYTAAKNMKRCPCCDGENVYGAKICRICGNDIVY